MDKIIYRALNALYVLSSVYITFSGGHRAFLGPVSLLFLLVPAVGERLFRMRLGYPMKTALVAFCFLAYNLGTALQWFDLGAGWAWFDRVVAYDNFVHCLSGILFTVIGLCFYGKLTAGESRGSRRLLEISYAFFFSMFVAVIWEIGEFTGFLLTGHDSQHTLTTGVFDTMEDIISCFAGSLLAALDYYVFTRGGGGLFMRLVRSFDRANSRRP